jgi:hypothetical protein
MEKHVGTSAGLLALLAFLMHSMFPPAGERETNGASLKKEATEVPAGPNAELEKAIPRAGPWLATRQYFHRTGSIRTKNSCFDDFVQPAEQMRQCQSPELRGLFGIAPDFDSSHLTTLIATIPDPLHTRMSLEADRYLDAIQQAAFRDRWELATQWLPWTAKIAAGPSNTSDPKMSPAVDLEKMPGLMVFRPHFQPKSDLADLLFVFVVGETPTAGINGFQYENAVRYITGLSSPLKRLTVLGPNFSGSFPSLTKLIREDGGAHEYAIQSGNVSNSKYAQRMLEILRGRNVSFHGSTLPSQAFEEQLKKLAERQGFRLDEVAELVEDESGFSASFGTALEKPKDEITAVGEPKNKIRTFRYPRDIAQLRNAYSDVAFSNPQQQKQEGTNSQALELSLKDTQSGESVFPIFSTSHTPVSQNAILEQIIDSLNHRHIRLVSLSATNVFDTIFLAKVLNKECPDIRIVLSSADLLFVQEAAQSSLTGLLAISPFPLFPEGSAWANHDPRDITSFGNTDSIGEYNAALSLLRGSAKMSNGSDPEMQAFEPSPKNFLSAWLLVLGHHGWLPVDLLDQNNPPLTPGQEWFEEKSEPPPTSQAELAALMLPGVPQIWIVVCLAAACLSLAVCIRLAYLELRPRVRVWSAFCLADLKHPLSRFAHARYVCLFACLASLAFLNGVLLAPMEAARFPAQDSAMSLAWLVRSAFLLPLVIVFVLLFRIPVRMSQSQDVEGPVLTQRFLYGTLCLRLLGFVIPLVALFFWSRLCFAPGVEGPLFCYRALSLSAPISPAWPLLLSSATLFVVAFFHLRRFTWADRQQPGFETTTLDSALWGRLHETKNHLDHLVASPACSSMTARIGAVGVVLAVVFLLNLFFSDQSLRSFESRSFENLLIALLLPLSIFVTGSFFQFASIWAVLRDLLSTLNSLDIGRFFGRLPDFEGSGPVWIRDLKLVSLATSVNATIALHNLGLEMPSLYINATGYWQALKTYMAPMSAGRDRSQLLVDFRAFRNKAIEITKDLSVRVLTPYWRANRIPFVQAREKESEARGDARTEAASGLAMGAAAGVSGSQATAAPPVTQPIASPAPAAPEPEVNKEAFEMASKYVALQYAVFISYALRHVQNLLMCCVVSFVLLVLSLHSFSFQSPQAISRFILLSLFLGGVIVVRVLAQLERNPIVSRLSGSEEGQLGKDFYLRVLMYGALPVLTVLGTQFPSISRFLTSWAEPTLEAIR